MDMTKYLEIFLEESQEHLQKLDEALLQLEASPDNRQILDEIFRSAHTLKGMSATMGYTRVAELTHEMENVLHKLRSGEVCCYPQVVDLLFKCVDSLKIMINDIVSKNEVARPIDILLAELRNCERFSAAQQGLTTGVNNMETKVETVQESGIDFGQFSSVVFNEYEKNLIKQAVKEGYNCYHIVVCLVDRCVMKSARAFMVFKNIEQIGEIIKCIPGVTEIEEEKFDHQFEIIVLSKESRQTLRRIIVAITEVKDPEINQLNDTFNNGFGVRREQAEEAEPYSVPDHGPLLEAQDTLVPTQVMAKVNHTVRVDKSRLESLMNLVGELVINKTRLEQIGRSSQIPEFLETLEQMDRTTSDLQNVIMKVRMVPIDSVFSRFPRMIRDLARELDKEIELIVEGKDTELDRTVVEELGDPLVHLLRNCVDHGIEDRLQRQASGKSANGTIRLTARYEGNNVFIEVEDDGRGIDSQTIKRKAVEKGLLLPEEAAELDEPSILRLIFQPGFSTSEKVTDISGRGVGLDAVKNKIEALSGKISIEGNPQQGAKFVIQLPLTIAITQALLVSVENEIYAIPLSFISETTYIMPENINRMQDQEYMILRGELIQLVRLSEVFKVPPSEIIKETEINIVIARKGEQRVGIIVDTLMGQQEIVIKPLSRLLGNTPALSGATILGNGQVSLIIDVAGLL